MDKEFPRVAIDFLAYNEFEGAGIEDFVNIRFISICEVFIMVWKLSMKTGAWVIYSLLNEIDILTQNICI